MQRNATQCNGRASRPPPMTSRRNEPMASLRHRPRCSLGAEPISCRNGAAESCAGGARRWRSARGAARLGGGRCGSSRSCGVSPRAPPAGCSLCVEAGAVGSVMLVTAAVPRGVHVSAGCALTSHPAGWNRSQALCRFIFLPGLKMLPTIFI